MSKNLIVLSAHSGTGKTTICKELLKRNKNWKFSISATTRPIREKEVDGKDYYFYSKEKFEHKEKFGEFIECEWVHGNRYGTLIEPIEKTIEKGGILLLDIEWMEFYMRYLHMTHAYLHQLFLV